MTQHSKGRRRGDVFAVRLTPEERAKLEALRERESGPRALGPWLVWRALRDRQGSAGAAGGVVPDQGYRLEVKASSSRYYRE
jgi:hypothetical protein